VGVSASRPRAKPRSIGAAGALAAVLFIALFRLRRLGPLDFWSWLVLDVVLVVAAAFVVDRGYVERLRRDARAGLVRKAALGILSAGLLYAIFAVGRAAALRLFPFAGSGIGHIYALREGVPLARVALLLALVIGPGEEIFWRGFFQELTGATTSPAYGFALTAILYAAVHLASGNPMLVMAAAVCGVFWGWLYFRFRSPILNAVSHAVWDLAVFVVFSF
jgi:membrane protease YdiL (CAAX protease family)